MLSENLIKTNGKQLFEKSGNACKIPDKNQWQMEENRSKRGKRPPKSLKKHYLEKVFASRFRQVENRQWDSTIKLMEF